MKLTREKLFRVSGSGHSGWNRDQLAILGVLWPPQKGWLAQVVGKTISEADFEKLLSLRKMPPKQRRKTNTPFLFGNEF